MSNGSNQKSKLTKKEIRFYASTEEQDLARLKEAMNRLCCL